MISGVFSGKTSLRAVVKRSVIIVREKVKFWQHFRDDHLNPVRNPGYYPAILQYKVFISTVCHSWLRRGQRREGTFGSLDTLGSGTDPSHTDLKQNC